MPQYAEGDWRTLRNLTSKNRRAALYNRKAMSKRLLPIRRLLVPLMLVIGTTGLLHLPSAFGHQSKQNLAPVSGRITAENVHRFRVGGMDAQGGIGDWFLSNGVICAIVSDASQESALTYQGGFLTDLGFCGRYDDHFLAYYPAINMSLTGIVPMRILKTALNDSTAEIHTVGERDGIRLSIRFRVDSKHPETLSIKSTVEQIGEGKSLQSYGEAFLTADSMQMFDVASNPKLFSKGFQNVENDLSDSDVTIVLGAGDPGHNIAYGFRSISAQWISHTGKVRPLLAKNTTGVDVSTRLLVPGFELSLGDKLVMQSEIILSQEAKVSPLTDRLWPKGFEISGSAAESEVALLIENLSGSAITHVTSNANGEFSFKVPAKGDYLAKVRAKGRSEALYPFTVDNADLRLPDINLPPPAFLHLPQGEIMRLSFKGIDGSKDPDFISPHTDYQVKVGDRIHEHGRSRHVFLSADSTDPKVLSLAPGTYLITASRGPEYSAHQLTLTLLGGSKTKLKIKTPKHIVLTPGYISADFHVHSGQSFDNNLDALSRVKSYVAQGAEVLVATEHDTIFDFTETIKNLGLADVLKTITGTELTTEMGNPAAPYGIGHANIFPLRVQTELPRRGAPKHENHRWRDIMATVRKDNQDAIIQLNHPLSSGDGGLSVGLYFSHMAMKGVSFDPTKALKTSPNNILIEPDSQTGIRDIDFDVIEIENGNRWGKRYLKTRDAWFALLRQGIRMSASANSDSHGVKNGSLAANVRNMVYIGTDELNEYQQSSLLSGIRTGNYYGTNGPILDISLNNNKMGSLASGAKPVLRLKVEAADWMKVDHYRVFINGEMRHENLLSVGQLIKLPLDIQADAFVTVEVTGPITDISREVIGEVAPFAFSNPIFFDADGDDHWTPIGKPLPKRLIAEAP
jgi:hypothetical protein